MKRDKLVVSIQILAALLLIAGIITVVIDATAEIMRVDVHSESVLRVRVGPGTEYESRWALSDGATVQVLQTANGWSQIAWPSYPETPIGWVCSDYLK